MSFEKESLVPPDVFSCMCEATSITQKIISFTTIHTDPPLVSVPCSLSFSAYFMLGEFLLLLLLLFFQLEDHYFTMLG